MTPFTRWAALLGRRTGSLHAALARGRRSPDFAPEPLMAAMRAKLARKLARQAADTVAMIGKVRNRLPVAQREAVDRLAGLPSRVHPILSALRRTPIAAQIARTHGDYHLGQVLFTGKDFAIIDFEGEPARSLADRRAKHSPLRDVAGMLRSFHYAACMGLAAAGNDVAGCWCDAVSAAFLRGYRATAPKSVLPKNERDFRLLLDVYLLEKALYELRYEMNNRPDWVHVPLAGLTRAMEMRPLN